MKQGRNRFGLFVAGMLVPLMVGTSAHADDTELFVAAFDPVVTGAQPNIMFIMDTSGSMTNKVITQVAWNPNEDFDGCYETGAIYWTTSGATPDCSSDNYFWKGKNYCEASFDDLAGVGQYQDGFKAWRGYVDRWVNLAGNRKNRRHECATDQGVHGEFSGGSDPWAVDGDEGPWANDDDDKVNYGTTYTIYDGNWLNWNSTGGTVETTRIAVIKDVTKQLLDNISGVNVGLMRFNRNQYASQSGGPVVYAMNDVDAARESMKDVIDGLPADGWTPLSETLYEAGQYFAGRAVDMGNNGPNVYSVPESRVGGLASSTTYNAPGNFQCQKNYAVMLTDGAPTRDTDANSEIQALPGFSTTVGSCDGTGHGRCLDDMADYLFNYDLDPDLPGEQNVTTYTIGFAVDLPILKSTAERGGGEYRLADDTASLTTVLTQIVQSILDDATTFTAPSVPVNAFNRTRNLDDVFVSVFEPSNRVHWPGNLKKYRLVNGQLVGQDGAPAVDPQTGFFSKDSFSYWSDEQDGNNVGVGGAAHEQPAYASRNLYTNLAGGMLTSAGNEVSVDNAVITSAVLGSPGIERDNVILWARGKDLLDQDDDDNFADDRNMMGDPLHVRPVTISYGGDPALGTLDATIYISTNDGYLHAINPEDGSERWAFIPDRLLGRLYDLYSDEIVPQRSYGLDGEIAAYITNNDRQPGINPQEKVYIVFGMRRGGDSLFAMDVTNPNQPKLAWEIDSNTPGFEDMGQTWSRPHLDTLNVSGVKTHVAIFGGGYDDGQDSSSYQEDNAGNAIYMVNLETGQLIWSAGPSDATRSHDLQLDSMRHSIPAPVKVVDLTGDDIPDRMYVGDMGGRVWRFDIINGNGPAELVEGGMLATLGAADLPSPPPASEIRRFYASPDVVAVLSDEPGESYLSINIGSGHRARPLASATQDEFFAVRDFNIFNVVETDDYEEPVNRDNLLDITNDTAPTMLPTDPGWRLRMVESGGEKVLTESFSFDGEIFFTSFSPGGTSACEASKGTNRLYRVNITDGSPVPPIDNPYPPDEPPEEDDRFKQLKQGGIAPDAVFFFPEDKEGDPILCIGAECIDPGFDERTNRTYWSQDETQ